jgi:hypothetical protein
MLLAPVPGQLFDASVGLRDRWGRFVLSDACAAAAALLSRDAARQLGIALIESTVWTEEDPGA